MSIIYFKEIAVIVVGNLFDAPIEVISLLHVPRSFRGTFVVRGITCVNLSCYQRPSRLIFRYESPNDLKFRLLVAFKTLWNMLFRNIFVGLSTGKYQIVYNLNISEPRLDEILCSVVAVAIDAIVVKIIDYSPPLVSRSIVGFRRSS